MPMADKRATAGIAALVMLIACCALVRGFFVGVPTSQPRAVVVMKAGSRSSRQAQGGSSSRRDALQTSGAAGLLASAMLLGSLPRPASAAESGSAAYSQVLAGYKELVALDGPEWSATKEKGGDEIRRKLGFVGTKSPLFKISKAFKTIQDELLEGDGSGADPLEFADAAQRVLDKIKDADFLAYSSNFANYGNGGGGTDYLEESHKAIKPALEAFQELVDMLKL